MILLAYPLAHFMARKGKQLEPAVSDVSDASDSKPEDEELLTKNAQIEELENNLSKWSCGGSNWWNWFLGWAFRWG